MTLFSNPDSALEVVHDDGRVWPVESYRRSNTSAFLWLVIFDDGHQSILFDDSGDSGSGFPYRVRLKQPAEIAQWAFDMADKKAGIHWAFTSELAAKYRDTLARYIEAHEPKPVDPLVEVWTALWPEDTGIKQSCTQLRAELAKAGLEITPISEVKP